MASSRPTERLGMPVCISISVFARPCITSLIAILSVFFWPVHAQAMWAGMTDAQLVKHSELVVQATYLDNTQIRINETDKTLNIGVLHVTDTLKGNKQAIILLHLPALQDGPRRSDEIFFRPGQKGLWFLNKAHQQNGLYKVEHPQRFIPEDRVKSRLESFRKLLEK